jgi:lipoprotein-anchoring transpeptidase ErfK/SrfK
VPAKVTLPAMLIASLLAVAAPVLAETPPSQPSTTAPVPSDEAADTTVAVGEITDTTLDVDGPLNTTVTGPASVPGAVPTRGPQVQLATPPPSPFDPPADGGFGRRVVYSKSQQTVWAYDETNTIIKMHRVSGRQDPRDPLPGTYRVWSRSSRTFSINNPTITWNYMVRFAKGDRDGNIGFHDIPYQYGQPVQTIDQLGQALSGGCVRQAPEDAIWMWNWAQLGTVVVVTP